MDIKKLLPYFVCLLLVVSLSSCDKDDEKDKEPTKRDLLTAHTWSFKEAETIIYFELLGDLKAIELTTANMVLVKEVNYLNIKNRA